MRQEQPGRGGPLGPLHWLKILPFEAAAGSSNTELLWARKAATVQQAVDAALRKHGPGASWAYMPEGSLTLPVRRQFRPTAVRPGRQGTP